MAQQKVALKDTLFNESKIIYLAENIKKIYPDFASGDFVYQVCKQFLNLELKQRIFHITDMLHEFLPWDYEESLVILLKSLPKPLDETKHDDDFWDFIFAPYWEFIAKYGCNNQYLLVSLSALKECTQRFSMEFAIRPFLKKYPNETMKYVMKWSQDKNYHVRRLASEGIRPNLPWWWKLDLWVEKTFKILDNLFVDHTQYVLRSVANNLNDLSKIDDKEVIKKLLEWKKSWKQNEKNIQFLISHSLRTQIKLWNPKALELLGYYMPAIKLSDFEILTPKLSIWNSLEFWFKLYSKISQKLLINYDIHFVTARGTLSNKTFHIAKKQLWKSEEINITKKHPLKSMTTKKLYSWKHFVEIFVNGESFWKKEFEFTWINE